jgi:hypothetical protein
VFCFIGRHIVEAEQAVEFESQYDGPSKEVRIFERKIGQKNGWEKKIEKKKN